MCGRYTLLSSGESLQLLFGFPEAPSLTPRYNIAPTQPVLAVRQTAQGGRELPLLRWGLIPSWAKDPAIGNRMTNARAETVADKPAFRTPFRRRRCLVPADGFYEWQTIGRLKQPIHFRMKGGLPFAFAGLWDQWRGPGGEQIESCTVLTTEANELVHPVHDRMPVILRPEDFAVWLDGVQKPEVLLPLLRPYPAAEMEARLANPWVNDARHEGPQCLEAGLWPELFAPPQASNRSA
jgi:putative SOS response-associated peptidase YedK